MPAFHMPVVWIRKMLNTGKLLTVCSDKTDDTAIIRIPHLTIWAAQAAVYRIRVPRFAVWIAAARQWAAT